MASWEAGVTAPLQHQWHVGCSPAHGLRQIPWALAEEAYTVYAGRYGHSQSLVRLCERGGFSEGELDMFIPGWRQRWKGRLDG